MHNILFKISSNIKNIPGWNYLEKAVVIECDDWGAHRMPSIDIYNKLLNEGISVQDGRYNQFDCLESPSDLEALYKVLLAFSDMDGNHPIFTSFFNLASPNFNEIKVNNFNNYYYKNLDEILLENGTYKEMKGLYKLGIESKIFSPQLHGRDHISVQYWLNELKTGNRDVLKGFENNFVFVKSKNLPKHIQQFRPEFCFYDNNSYNLFKSSICDGSYLFKKIFNYAPTIFVPANGIFPASLESTLYNNGIRYLNTVLFPGKLGGKWNMEVLCRRTGQLSRSGLRYYLRNVVFEPCSSDFKNIDNTLLQIESAFRWNKPAIISTHRVNYVGTLSESNRKKGLFELENLLKSILNKWPDVKFYSTESLFERIAKSKK